MRAQKTNLNKKLEGLDQAQVSQFQGTGYSDSIYRSDECGYVNSFDHGYNERDAYRARQVAQQPDHQAAHENRTDINNEANSSRHLALVSQSFKLEK